MPFTKTGPDEYTSPSGRKFTGAQVRLYYATDGFKEQARGHGKTKSAKRRRRH